MKKLLVLTTGLLIVAGNAFASGSHSGGHDEAKKELHGHEDTKIHGHDVMKKEMGGYNNSDSHHDSAMAVGEPGKAKDARKRITIVMKETDDGDMIFTPKRIKVKEGQTIAKRLNFDYILSYDLSCKISPSCSCFSRERGFDF